MLKAQSAVASARPGCSRPSPRCRPIPTCRRWLSTTIDKAELRKELADIRAADRRRAGPGQAQQGRRAQPSDARADEIVGLETKHKDLKRAVDEEREAVQSLADGVFRAEIAANQQMAENNANLAVVDPAFKPIKPHGKGKKFIVMAGLVLFGGLGGALALGLALLDDRVYRRSDVERLDLAPVLAVIPKQPKQPKSPDPDRK